VSVSELHSKILQAIKHWMGIIREWDCM